MISKSKYPRLTMPPPYDFMLPVTTFQEQMSRNISRDSQPFSGSVSWSSGRSDVAYRSPWYKNRAPVYKRVSKGRKSLFLSVVLMVFIYVLGMVGGAYPTTDSAVMPDLAAPDSATGPPVVVEPVVVEAVSTGSELTTPSTELGPATTTGSEQFPPVPVVVMADVRVSAIQMFTGTRYLEDEVFRLTDTILDVKKKIASKMYLKELNKEEHADMRAAISNAISSSRLLERVCTSFSISIIPGSQTDHPKDGTVDDHDDTRLLSDYAKTIHNATMQGGVVLSFGVVNVRSLCDVLLDITLWGRDSTDLAEVALFNDVDLLRSVLNSKVFQDGYYGYQHQDSLLENSYSRITALQIAIKFKSKDMVALLLNRCEHALRELNEITWITDYEGQAIETNPLHYAVQQVRETEIVNLLINAGAKSVPDRRGFYPFHYAAQLGKDEILRLLLNRFPKVHLGDLGPCAGAPESAEHRAAIRIVGECPSQEVAIRIYYCDSYLWGPRPIHLAAHNNHASTIVLLCKEFGADPNSCSYTSVGDFAICGILRAFEVPFDLALCRAARRGNCEAVKALLECKADVNLPSAFWLTGETHMWEYEDYDDMVDYIDGGCKITVDDIDGGCKITQMGGGIDGDDIDLRCRDDNFITSGMYCPFDGNRTDVGRVRQLYTALHCAVMGIGAEKGVNHDRPECVRLLVQAKADVNAVAIERCLTIDNYVREIDRKAEKRDWIDRKAIHIAAWTGSAECLKVLLDGWPENGLDLHSEVSCCGDFGGKLDGCLRQYEIACQVIERWQCLTHPNNHDLERIEESFFQENKDMISGVVAASTVDPDVRSLQRGIQQLIWANLIWGREGPHSFLTSQMGKCPATPEWEVCRKTWHRHTCYPPGKLAQQMKAAENTRKVLEDFPLDSGLYGFLTKPTCGGDNDLEHMSHNLVVRVSASLIRDEKMLMLSPRTKMEWLKDEVFQQTDTIRDVKLRAANKFFLSDLNRERHKDLRDALKVVNLSLLENLLRVFSLGFGSDAESMVECGEDEEKLSQYLKKEMIGSIAREGGEQLFFFVIYKKGPTEFPEDFDLFDAVTMNNIDLVKAVLDTPKYKENPRKINEESEHRFLEVARHSRKQCWSALVVAIKFTALNIVKLILERTQVDLKGLVYTDNSRYQSYPLHYAVQEARLGSVEGTAIVRLLLDAGAECIPDERGFYPVHYAARAGNDDVLRLLLSRSCNSAEIPTKLPKVGLGYPRLRLSADEESIGFFHGERPIHLAAHNNRMSTIKILCQEFGADPNSFSNTSAHHRGVLNALALFSVPFDLALCRAARRGNCEAVKALLECKADVNLPSAFVRSKSDNSESKEPHFDSQKDSVLPPRLNIRGGSNTQPNEILEQLYVPLHCAVMGVGPEKGVEHDRPECVRILLEARADASVVATEQCLKEFTEIGTEFENRKAVDLAAWTGSAECLKILLDGYPENKALTDVPGIIRQSAIIEMDSNAGIYRAACKLLEYWNTCYEECKLSLPYRRIENSFFQQKQEILEEIFEFCDEESFPLEKVRAINLFRSNLLCSRDTEHSFITSQIVEGCLAHHFSTLEKGFSTPLSAAQRQEELEERFVAGEKIGRGNNDFYTKWAKKDQLDERLAQKTKAEEHDEQGVGIIDGEKVEKNLLKRAMVGDEVEEQ